MNQYPFIPPLAAKEVKELCRQIRVLRGDYPGLSDRELAEEWAERQHDLIAQGRPSAFIDWIEGGRWLAGFERAASHASRQTEQKQRARVQRRRWKDILLDKQPSTPRQQRYVTRLAKGKNLVLATPPEGLSKLAASRLIRQLLDGNPPKTP